VQVSFAIPFFRAFVVSCMISLGFFLYDLFGWFSFLYLFFYPCFYVVFTSSFRGHSFEVSSKTQKGYTIKTFAKAGVLVFHLKNPKA